MGDKTSFNTSYMQPHGEKDMLLGQRVDAERLADDPVVGGDRALGGTLEVTEGAPGGHVSDDGRTLGERPAGEDAASDGRTSGGHAPESGRAFGGHAAEGERVPARLRIRHTPNGPVRLTPTEMRIVSFIQRHEGHPCSKAQIAVALGRNEKTVDRLLSRLRRNGLVVSEPVHAANGAQLANLYRLTKWAKSDITDAR